MILLTVEVSSFYQEGSKGAELIPGARVKARRLGDRRADFDER
jgi:hypothetical protein